MKKLSIIAFTSLILFVFGNLLFTSCQDDVIGDDTSDIDEEVLTINKWINDVMHEVYLWEKKIPSSLDFKKEEDSKAFFEKMIYSEEDHWSWITDDWKSYQDQLLGEYVTMGYSPAFVKFNDSDDVFIVVEYVFKDSPAEKNGIKRGDIILTIDGTQLNVDNYYDLYSGDLYTIGKGTYSAETGSISLNNETVELEAKEVTANPVIHYSIIDHEGAKVGYLVYTDFTKGTGDVFHREIDKAMDYFKEQSISDMVVDLRYNPGGEIVTAAYFASALVPQSAILDERVLINMVYNNFVQDYFEQNNDDERLAYKFPENKSNLNLNEVYFLTTGGSASASELVITGLEPYMNVVQVGDTTHGKYTGAWVLPDTNDPPQHNWAMIPIVLKYSNAKGFTDFKDGLVPDIYVKDQLLGALPFGDKNDPVLAAALQQITGVAPAGNLKSARIKANYKRIFPKEMELQKTLTVPIPDDIKKLYKK